MAKSEQMDYEASPERLFAAVVIGRRPPPEDGGGED